MKNKCELTAEQDDYVNDERQFDDMDDCEGVEDDN
jgi:hypothetical protein